MSQLARKATFVSWVLMWTINCGSSSVPLDEDADGEHLPDGDVDGRETDVEALDVDEDEDFGTLPDQDTWHMYLYPMGTGWEYGSFGGFDDVVRTDSGETYALGRVGFYKSLSWGPPQESDYRIVLKLDRFGNVLWNKTFRHSPEYELEVLWQGIGVLNNGIVVFSECIKSDAILRFDEDGKLVGTYSLFRDMKFVTKTSEHKLLLSSRSSQGIHITQFDGDLNIEWDRVYTSNNTFGRILATMDGNIMLYGGEQIIRLNNEGDVIWAQRYGGRILDLVEVPTGEFIVAGTADFLEEQTDYAWVASIDIEGNILWSKVSGEPRVDGETYWVNRWFEAALALPERNEVALRLREHRNSIDDSSWVYFLEVLNTEAQEFVRTLSVAESAVITPHFASENRVVSAGGFFTTDWPGTRGVGFVTVTNVDFEVEGGCPEIEEHPHPLLETHEEVLVPREFEVSVSDSEASLQSIYTPISGVGLQPIYRCPEGE